jgi:lipopolysaccharide transport system ATP-binding protein
MTLVSNHQQLSNPQQVMNSDLDQDVVLSVQGISKKFCRDFKRSLFYGVQDISKEVLGLRGSKNATLRKKEFWALQDVSFELRRGEALGLVGKNGSGKSTLLRIIAGLIKPDVGTVQVKGRVAPLIALSAGFNPVLTGRENIYANMSILGLSKEEIDAKFDAVVEFAEIPDAIDSPVRSYSSGMQARLGFSCAIHTAPDILLIDEVLAVGDVRFRAKCNRKLHKLRSQGTSLVLVSHQAQSMLNVCDSAIYLSRGEFIKRGEITEVITKYEQDLFEITDLEKTAKTNQFKDTSQIEEAGIVSAFFSDKKGKEIHHPTTGEPTALNITCYSKTEYKNVGITIDIQEISSEGENNIVLSSFNDQEKFDLTRGLNKFQIYFQHLCLKPGAYTMRVHLRRDSLYTFDSMDSYRFKVSTNKVMGRSSFYQPREWNLTNLLPRKDT